VNINRLYLFIFATANRVSYKSKCAGHPEDTGQYNNQINQQQKMDQSVLAGNDKCYLYVIYIYIY
jgi:hypothetical protein